MTDFDRNVRTLIACFVIAIFGLVPLRFVEISNYQTRMIEKQQVLGVTTDEVKKPEINLNKRCLNNEEILEKIDEIQQKINVGNLSEEELDQLLETVREIHSVRCR